MNTITVTEMQFTEFKKSLLNPALVWLEANSMQDYHKRRMHPVDLAIAIHEYCTAPQRKPFIMRILKEVEEDISGIEQQLEAIRQERYEQLQGRYHLITKQQIRVTETAEKIKQTEMFQEDLSTDSLTHGCRAVCEDLKVIRDELTRQKREAFSSPDMDTVRIWIQADAISDFQQNERRLFLDGFIGFDCKWDFEPRGSKARYLEYFKLLIAYMYFNATVNRSRVTYSQQREFVRDRYGCPGLDLLRESMQPDLAAASKSFPFIRANVKNLTK